MISKHLKIPIIVGGGVSTSNSAESLVHSGAGYIVIGTKLEQNPSVTELREFTNTVHKL